MARESGQTTSSLVSLFLLQQTRPGAGRQAQNLDEALGIFLVVAIAHGERRQIIGVERVRRMPSSHTDVSLVQRQLDRAGNQLLSVVDESVQGFAQRREPQAEVDQFGILERDLLL